MRPCLILFLTIGWVIPLDAETEVDYARDIKPLFAVKCGSCHGSLRQEAGLRLDAGELILRGGDGGEVVVAGRPEESLLFERVSTVDLGERMPPSGEGEPLDAEQISQLSDWIRAGAQYPEDEVLATDPRDHWAFQLPRRPEVPQLDDLRWSHPIDAFLELQRRRQGLVAVQQAEVPVLLRRLFFDLIGLPPTRSELAQRHGRPTSDQWANVVDSLLQSPHHGERWGRHWMDVWRYSDWDGFKNKLRGSQRHIWRWRDWILESLNEDKGYDQMIVEMLAGDELAPTDPSVLRATGFLARNYHHSNRNIWLDSTVEHTSKAFLGLTLNCARCHDHKYDPLPQQAYYQFRAIFEPHRVRADQIPGELNVMNDGLPRAFDADLATPTYLFQAGNEKHPDKEHPMQPRVPEILGGTYEVQPVELPLVAYYPALQGHLIQQQLSEARRQRDRAQRALKASLKASANSKQESRSDVSAGESTDVELLRKRFAVAELKVDSLEARYAADEAKYSETTKGSAEQLGRAAARSEREYVALREELAVEEKGKSLQEAQADTKKEEADRKTTLDKIKKELAAAEKNLKSARAALRKGDGEYAPLGTEYPRTSTGRRLALSRWITNAENPLTARVAINHIWLRHFGQPLVDNVFDFGLRSPRPIHVDLLDWLSVELIENNWSMKHIHRLIVTSRTWQLCSSSANSEHAERNEAIDPENRYLWRANIRRLDAEIVRDSILAVAGKLDRTLGGPDIDFRNGETTRRRSIYVQHAYEKQMTMLVLFDAASPNECYRRSQSIVPQQALALSNSGLSLGQSRTVATQLSQEVADSTVKGDRTFIESAFLRLLSRQPDEDEIKACLAFLADQANLLSEPSSLSTFVGGQPPTVEPSQDPHQRARENLVHVLLNHNDFVSVR